MKSSSCGKRFCKNLTPVALGWIELSRFRKFFNRLFFLTIQLTKQKILLKWIKEAIWLKEYVLTRVSWTRQIVHWGQYRRLFEMVLGFRNPRPALSIGRFDSIRSQFSWKKDFYKNFGPKSSLIGCSGSCPWIPTRTNFSIKHYELWFNLVPPIKQGAWQRGWLCDPKTIFLPDPNVLSLK